MNYVENCINLFHHYLLYTTVIYHWVQTDCSNICAEVLQCCTCQAVGFKTFVFLKAICKSDAINKK